MYKTLYAAMIVAAGTCATFAQTPGSPTARGSTVTSGGFGPSLNAPIAMGYIARDHAAEGTALSVVVRDVARPARVSAMPFVPTRYYRGS